jgi:hypothetical protein
VRYILSTIWPNQRGWSRHATIQTCRLALEFVLRIRGMLRRSRN